MAWIKFKDLKGDVYTVPESVFGSMFAGSDGFTLVQDSKPAPKKEDKIEKETVKDEQIHEHKPDENSIIRKSSKKTNS